MRKRLFALWARLEKHWLWPLLALLCLSTSLWVVHLVKTGVGLPLAIAQGLFYSLQFIVLNKQIDDISTGWLLFGLTFAQFALPLLASSVVLGGLFRAHMQPIWIRRFATSDLSGHHIVLGYGDLGKALVNQLILARQHVVAIDIQETDCQVSDSLTILQGDARSPIEDLFAGSQLPKARCLYLMLPDESANLDLLARLQAYITCSKHSSGRALSIYVRTETHALGQLFTDWVGLDSTHGQAQLDIRPINPYDIVARDVVNRYSPDCYVPTCRSGPIAQTIMIVGTSRMAQALLLRFTRIGIYAPHGKLRMVWVGDDVVEAFAALSADYPLLDAEHYPPAFWGADAATDPEYYALNLPPVDLIPLAGRADALLRAGSIQARCDGQLPAAIYVCHDDDIRNLKEARDLQAVLGADPPPASERRRLLLVLQNQAVTKLRAAQQWMRYDIVEAAIDRSFASTLVDDKADRLAARFKQAYDQSEGKPVSAWHSISHFEKESNRDAADHGAIKARYAGLPAGDVDKALFELASALPEAELQMSRERAALYAMEQRRYRAFMFMMGFRYREHDPQPSSLSKEDWRRTQRINPTLLQKRLSAYELDKDTNIVRITAQALNWTAEQKVG